MNAANDNNDPFEDIFRDRFADFESEPSEILWNKIEPQLPVKTTRRFPYWQVSALILGLFLAGFYFTQDEESTAIKPNFPNVNKTSQKSEISEKLSVQPSVGDNKIQQDENVTSEKSFIQYSIQNYKVRKDPYSIVEKSPSKVINHTEVSDNQHNIQKSQSAKTKIFNPRITEEQVSFSTSNNISERTLNPSNPEQSNLKINENLIIESNNQFSNSSNIFDSKSVLSNNRPSVIERKLNLSILDTKSYGLLTNHFKNPKLKFVTIPKEEPYFKERKPLELYVSAMPLLNYYTITPNGNDANFVHTIAVNDDADRVGFHAQAGLIFTLSDRLKLRTGLTFTNTNHSIGYKVRTDSLIVQPADNKGVDISFADLNKTYSQAANYLGTKIEVQYAFLQGEALTHYVSLGGEVSYRLNGNNALNGFANFAYGITRQIGDNAYIFIEPTFSYSLNQQSDNNSLLLVKPNKIGFNIGVNFKLK
jgi:hypothetical protein